MSVLGLAGWSPRPDSVQLILQVSQILQDNRNYLPLTGRQIFYMLVGQYDYPKTEEDYKNLLAKLNRARRAGMIPWSSIRDDGVTHLAFFADNPDIAGTLDGLAELFDLDPTLGQDVHVELWVEANGMTRQAARAVNPLGADVYSSGGFNSSTMKHTAAMRWLDRALDERRSTIMLHAGDHDPSGVAIFENLQADLTQFVVDILKSDRRVIDRVLDLVDEVGKTRVGQLLTPRFERIAITAEQALDRGYQSAPPKSTDSRSVNWVGETWQVEAIPPDELSQIFIDNVERHIDLDKLEEVREATRQIRERLIEWRSTIEPPDLSDIQIPGDSNNDDY